MQVDAEASDTFEGSLDITEDEMRAELLDVVAPDRHNIYNGPGVLTVSDMMEDLGFSRDWVNLKVRKRLAAGTLVEVRFKPTDRLGRPQRIRDGYVKREVYDKWQAEQGE